MVLLVSFSKVIAIAGLFLVALAALPSAFSLYAGTDSVTLTSCSAATVHVWVEGANSGERVYFSASTAVLTASFDSSSLTIPSSGTKGTNLRLSIPACFIGSKNIDVTAQVCGATCSTRTVTVQAIAQPCPTTTCGSYTFLDQALPQAPATSCGETGCSRVLSTVHYRSYYEPSEYRVAIRRATANYCFDNRRCDYNQANGAGLATVPYIVTNRGASGSFTLGVASLDSAVVVIPGRTEFDLAQGEEVRVPLDVNAKHAAPGVYAYTVSVYKDGREITSFRDHIEVITPLLQAPAAGSLKLVFPNVPVTGITVMDCQARAISVLSHLENTLPEAHDFAIDAFANGHSIASRSIRVPAGLAAEFNLDIDRNALEQGPNYVFVRAATDGWQGNGTIQISMAACGQNTGVATPATSQQGNRIVIVAGVRNSGPVALTNVTGRLEGVPASWNVSSDAVSIPAGAERNVTVTALSDTSDEVSPTLVIESNGVEIGRKKLEGVNKPQGITGLFTAALSENMFAIIVILVVCIAVFALYSRRGTKSEAQQEEEYRAKIRRIREEISRREAASG